MTGARTYPHPTALMFGSVGPGQLAAPPLKLAPKWPTGSWPAGCLFSEAASQVADSLLQRLPPTCPPKHPAPLLGGDEVCRFPPQDKAELRQPQDPAHTSSSSCQKSRHRNEFSIQKVEKQMMGQQAEYSAYEHWQETLYSNHHHPDSAPR